MAVQAALFNIFVVKQFNLFGLAVTGGNVLYGASFLATDILNEHFGRRVAQQAVWAGFGAGVFMLLTTQLTLAFTPNDFDTAQTAFATIFSPTTRIVLASLMTYLLVQSFDVWFFDWIKKKTAGRALWLRNNLSTLVSQAFDSILFTAAGLLIIPAFASVPWLVGFVPADAFVEIVLFTWLTKAVVAVLDTPVMYLTRNIRSLDS